MLTLRLSLIIRISLKRDIMKKRDWFFAVLGVICLAVFVAMSAVFLLLILGSQLAWVNSVGIFLMESDKFLASVAVYTAAMIIGLMYLKPAVKLLAHIPFHRICGKKMLPFKKDEFGLPLDI